MPSIITVLRTTCTVFGIFLSHHPNSSRSWFKFAGLYLYFCSICILQPGCRRGDGYAAADSCNNRYHWLDESQMSDDLKECRQCFAMMWTRPSGCNGVKTYARREEGFAPIPNSLISLQKKKGCHTGAENARWDLCALHGSSTTTVL